MLRVRMVGASGFEWIWTRNNIQMATAERNQPRILPMKEEDILQQKS